MKYSLILLAGFLFCSYSTNAQDCTKTYEISSENILKIFQELENHSIRGEQLGETWISTVCLDGQTEPAKIYFNKQSIEYDLASFTFLKESNENVASEMYNKLKMLLESAEPSGWNDEENTPYGNKYFFLRDSKENWSREVSLNFKTSFSKSRVFINFKEVSKH